MSKKKEEHIDEAVDELLELVKSQDKALKMANELLDMKGRLVSLCEEETALYKRENQRLYRVIFGLSVLLSATLVLLIAK